MKRLVSIFMLLVMIGLGTGLIQRLHMMQHEREDAAAEAKMISTPGPQAPGPNPHRPEHSEDHCVICAQFHAPLISISYVVWLIDTGERLGYVPMLAESQRSQTFALRFSCRGPPVASCE